jgi:lipid-A-disaccharide synthase
VLERLAGLDRSVFCLINQDASTEALDVFFGLLTHLGDGGVLAVLGLVGLYVFDRKNFPKNFLILAVVVLLGGLWVQLVKSIVSRPRPLKDPALGAVKAEMIQTHVIWWLHKYVYPLVSADASVEGVCRQLNIVGARLGSRSYPSGHSAAVFGTATALAYAYRRWAYLLFIPAAAVAVSRIYVGVHFPVDVLVGGAIGAVNALVLLGALKPYFGVGLVRPKTYSRPSSAKNEPVILIVAGEASADTYAANLMEKIKLQRPEARFVGVGGPKAIAAGLEAVGRAEEIAIVGFTGVLSGLGALKRIFRSLVGVLDTLNPDVLVCLDLPDFNLGLANQAKARGIPVLYYISPQVWAWRTGRLATIADRVDHMVVALPFEKEFYEQVGAPASFFGHPITETIDAGEVDRRVARAAHGIDPDRPAIVMAPGSRRNEIEHLSSTLAAAAKMLVDDDPARQIVVPLAPTVDEAKVAAYFTYQGVRPVFTRGDFFTLLACADAGAITSGTATLEAALAGLPHVICYRGNALNLWLARRLVKIDKIGLPNIILDRIAFTELIQEDCTPSIVAEHVRSLLLPGPVREAALNASKQVQTILACGNVSAEVAGQVLALVKRRRELAEHG